MPGLVVDNQNVGHVSPREWQANNERGASGLAVPNDRTTLGFHGLPD